MQRRFVVRYATKSPADADENQRRIEGVFAELKERQPGDVSYLVLRLADDSFVHVAFHDQRHDEVDPITSSRAFARFQEGHEDRRDGDVDQQTATLVGAYLTSVE
jgi:hypothetical protein